MKGLLLLGGGFGASFRPKKPNGARLSRFAGADFGGEDSRAASLADRPSSSLREAKRDWSPSSSSGDGGGSTGAGAGGEGLGRREARRARTGASGGDARRSSVTQTGVC